MVQVLEQYLSVGVLFLFAIVFVFLFIFVNKIMGPAKKEVKNQFEGISSFVAYECGEVPIGEAQSRFNFQYYVFALVFVVFDVVSSLLVAWALVIKPHEMYIQRTEVMGVFISAFIFIGILFVGFLYWWKRNALRWM